MAIENVQETFGKKQNCCKWEKDCAFLKVIAIVAVRRVD